MSLDNAIWLAYIVAEIAVLGLLFYRHAWRSLPIFCLYCAWDLLSNLFSYVVHHRFDTDYSRYFAIYLAQTITDFVLQFGVLVELAWSLLRPIRASLPHPRLTVFVLAVALLAVGAVIWGLTSFSPPGQLPVQMRFLFLIHLQQTFSLLRVLFFLGLACSSQLLSIGWRDRELQVATGLGIYSLVSLTVTALQTHETRASQYGHLNQFVVASFVGSLLYWVYSFAQQESARRAFTPQMESLLLSAAGAARASRTALTNTVSTQAEGGGKH
jgi:hypothetical protein